MPARPSPPQKISAVLLGILLAGLPFHAAVTTAVGRFLLGGTDHWLPPRLVFVAAWKEIFVAGILLAAGAEVFRRARGGGLLKKISRPAGAIFAKIPGAPRRFFGKIFSPARGFFRRDFFRAPADFFAKFFPGGGGFPRRFFAEIFEIFSSPVGLAAGAFLLFAAGFLVLGPGDFSAKILGFRVDAVWILLAVAVAAARFSPPQKSAILKTFAVAGAVAVAVGLFAYFSLPIEWRTAIGFRAIGGQFAPDRLPAGWFTLADGTRQAVGSFSSPNHLAAWILLWAPVAAAVFRGFWMKFFAVAGGAVLLGATLSAGATGGAAVAAGGFLTVRFFSKKTAQKILAGAGILAVAGWAAALGSGIFAGEIHFDRQAAAVAEISQNPLGAGLGAAGPVRNRLENAGHAPVAENFFLQVAQEMGVAGAAIFAVFCAAAAWILIFAADPRARAAGAGLAGLFAMSFFLHPLEAAPVALTAGALLGIFWPGRRAG